MSPGIIPVPGLYLLGWGLVPRWWSKAPKELKQATFNARAETVAEKIFFREAFKRRRCLIPVSGYYEWQDTPTGKQPWYFTARDAVAAAARRDVVLSRHETTDARSRGDVVFGHGHRP